MYIGIYSKLKVNIKINYIFSYLFIFIIKLSSYLIHIHNYGLLLFNYLKAKGQVRKNINVIIYSLFIIRLFYVRQFYIINIRPKNNDKCYLFCK